MKTNENKPDSIEILFESLFPRGTDEVQIIEKLCAMDSHPRINELRAYNCTLMLSALMTSLSYADNLVFVDDPSYQSYCRLADKLDPEETLLKSFGAFFWGKKETAQKLIFQTIDNDPPTAENPIGENEIAYYFIAFKNRFSSFWPALKSKYAEYGAPRNILDLCDLIPRFNRGSLEEKAVMLSEYLSIHPNSQFVRELLGSVCFSMKLWNNTIANLESITEPMFIHVADLLWYLGISSDKIRDYSSAEGYYRECLELFPEERYMLNSLGYILLKQKKYSDALDVFEKCLRENRDLPYSAQNYVKALLYLGRTKDALAMIQSGKYRFPKSLTDKVIKAHKTGAKTKPVNIEDDSRKDAPVSKRIQSSVRDGSQFLNERLLEDELEAKINAGVPVFGKKLRVFKRKGEYGRQYAIPNGRVDLLCEDDEGNIYIVELKRDKGYDNVYSQTARYLDWFAKNERFNKKKITGIICLNGPTRELVELVRKDGRIKLFEYLIQYSEVL